MLQDFGLHEAAWWASLDSFGQETLVAGLRGYPEAFLEWPWAPVLSSNTEGGDAKLLEGCDYLHPSHPLPLPRARKCQVPNRLRESTLEGSDKRASWVVQ